MSITSIPNCIQLLSIIGELAMQIEDCFDPKNELFTDLKTRLKSQKSYTFDSEFHKDKYAIIYLQILLLLALSFHGGIFIPLLKNIQKKDDTIKLNLGIADWQSFRVGVFDEELTTFAHLIIQKVLGRAKPKAISFNTIRALQQQIKNYNSILSEVEKKLSHFRSDPSSLQAALENDPKKDVLFIILACFPTDQINALFLHIQTFLPDNLVIRNKNNDEINITSLFESPSTDPHNLLNKIIIYFELYYSADLPIIRHITQSKTSTFMTELMGNAKMLNTTHNNLKHIIDGQIVPRQQMYSLFETHLKKISS